MTVNCTKLTAELKAAGIPITGCSSTGRIDFLPEATDTQRARAAELLAAHDPVVTLTPDEKVEALELSRGRVVAALVIRAQPLTVTTTAERTWAQGILDAALTRIREARA